jgi:hypothetical protein
MPPQHAAREQRGEQVGGNRLARLVDEDRPVGVAVEGDPEIGAAEPSGSK